MNPPKQVNLVTLLQCTDLATTLPLFNWRFSWLRFYTKVLFRLWALGSLWQQSGQEKRKVVTKIHQILFFLLSTKSKAFLRPVYFSSHRGLQPWLSRLGGKTNETCLPCARPIEMKQRVPVSVLSSQKPTCPVKRSAHIENINYCLQHVGSSYTW